MLAAHLVDPDRGERGAGLFDPAQRWQSWKITVDAGILDPDEIREEEGWNPRGNAAPAPNTVLTSAAVPP
jgi:phage portal protein BeeE